MSENSYTIQTSRYSVRISVQTEQSATQVFSVAKELHLIYRCLAIQFAHVQFSPSKTTKLWNLIQKKNPHAPVR